MCNKNNLFASSIVEHNIPPHLLINQPYKLGCSFTFDATHSAGYSPAFKIFLKHLANFLIVILVTTRNDFLCFPTACMETLSSLGTKSSTNSDRTVPSPHFISSDVLSGMIEKRTERRKSKSRFAIQKRLINSQFIGICTEQKTVRIVANNPLGASQYRGRKCLRHITGLHTRVYFSTEINGGKISGLLKRCIVFVSTSKHFPSYS